MLCVITGKGPLKAHYEAKIDAMDLQHVKVSVDHVLLPFFNHHTNFVVCCTRLSTVLFCVNQEVKEN